MKRAGGRREAGGDNTDADERKPFAEVMREQGMAAPAALSRSLDAALGGHEPETAEGALRAAERLLERVLVSQCESRDAALDLLTVDALMTRAMEIAARDPNTLAEFPEVAMKRIAAK